MLHRGHSIRAIARTGSEFLVLNTATGEKANFHINARTAFGDIYEPVYPWQGGLIVSNTHTIKREDLEVAAYSPEGVVWTIPLEEEHLLLRGSKYLYTMFDDGGVVIQKVALSMESL